MQKSSPLKKEYEKFDQCMPLQIAKIKGANFPYRYYRNPNPQKDVTLIFLAGGTGLSDSLFLLFSSLAEKYHLVTFPYPKDFDTNGKLADAVAALIEKLELKNIYLVGQSYGGLFAQVMAKRYPSLLKGLILSGTCSMYNDLSYQGIVNIFKMINPKKLKRNLTMDKMLPNKLLPFVLKLVLKRVSVKQNSPYDLSEVVDLLKDNITSEYWYHMDLLLGDLMNEFGTHRPEDFITFQNEVMLIFSEKDTIFSDELKDALIRLMPSQSIIHYLEGGHLALIMKAQDYLAKIEEFISMRN